MKNFTMNFLREGRSTVRFLRKIGLSLVVLFWTVGAFAQEHQSTYEVWAVGADYCYQEDNVYEVQIKMKDFVKFYDFELNLNFNGTNFNYLGVTNKVAELTNMTIAVVNTNTVRMNWTTQNAGAPDGSKWSTIEESDDAPGGITVFTLRFELKNTPYHYSTNSVFAFTSDLKWGDSYYRDLPTQNPIITFNKFDGTMKVTEKWEDIIVTQSTPDCSNGLVTLTVTDPVGTGLQYSWNGKSFQDVNTTTVLPSDVNIYHTVRVRDASGCMSYIKTVEVIREPSVTFTYLNPVYADCPGGAADLEIIAKGGTAPYKYYVVPSTLWPNILNNSVELEKYSSSNFVWQLDTEPHAPWAYAYYYIAVQDANGCINLHDQNVWQWVTAIDDIDPFVATVNNGVVCGGGDGSISVTLAGGTPFNNGYNIFADGAYVSRGWTYTKNNLASGSYYVRFEDANGCVWDETYTITDPAPIKFELDWKDTGCQQAEGELWIVQGSITGGQGDLDDWYWDYSTDPNFQLAGHVWRVDGAYTVATNIPAGVYYMRLYDANGCVKYWENAEKDNAIKIMDVLFKVDYNVLCYGAENVPVKIVLTSGHGNHDFEYSKDGGTTWQESNEFIIPKFIANDTTVHFVVKDNYANNCLYDLTTIIHQNPKLSAKIIPYLTLGPTCPESADGNLAFSVTGGTPFANGGYEYKVCNGHFYDGESGLCNDGQWVKSNSAQFSINVGIDNKMHTYYFRDANGCETRVFFNFPNFENRIAFQDVIELSCPLDKVNLLHAAPTPENCQNEIFGICWDNFAFGATYLDLYDPEEERWEDRLLWQWHGIPLGHVIKLIDWSDWQSFLPVIRDYFHSWGIDDTDDLINEIIAMSQTSITFQDVKDFLAKYGIDVYGVDELTVDNVQKAIDFFSSFNFEYRYWTSDEGWKYVVTQGLQALRSPYIYWSSEYDSAAEIYTYGQMLTHETAFGAGTYYLVARDEFGCYSNVEKIEIVEPPRLDITVTTEEATCYGAIDGKIIIKAVNGSTEMIPGTPWTNPALQYVIIDNPAIFNVQNWHRELTWLPMDANPFEKIFKAGTYWVIVRDYCALLHPELIVVKEVTIGGGQELIINKGLLEITDVTCNVQGKTPTNDGSLVIPDGAITGGKGSYTYLMTNITTGINYNPTGNTFSNLPGGTYTLTVTDAIGCTATEEIIILADPFYVETFHAYPSCFDLHDGFIRYHIYGGTAPFYETTNNIGLYEDVTQIPANRWYTVDKDTYVDYGAYKAHDRRVRSGQYEIYVKDSKGCIYGPVYIDIKQPAQLGISDVLVEKTCTDGNDGKITLYPQGGWDRRNDDYYLYVQLYKGATLVQTKTYDTIDVRYNPIYFEGLAEGAYTVRLYEFKAGLWGGADPIITYSDYFSRFDEYVNQLPWQNNSQCTYTQTVNVSSFEIDYEREFYDASCYDAATGVIKIFNVSGGVGPYRFGLEGPDGSGYEDLVYYPVGGAWSYTFDDLVHGHYNIHIMDSNGCHVFRESAEINKPNELTLQLELVRNATCYGGEGEFQMIATGGSGEYEYATLPANYNFPANFNVTNLDWQTSATFEKEAGVWVGYVRDKNNPSCWTGAPTDNVGTVLQQHRVVILQPTPVTIWSLGVTPAVCYAQNSGKIHVTKLSGGNGEAYSAVVTGTRYDGEAVSVNYPQTEFKNLVRKAGTYVENVLEPGTTIKMDSLSFELQGLYASTNKLEGTPADKLEDADYYTVTFYDSKGCPSDSYKVVVYHPEEFIITLENTQDAFICYNDLAGIFEIKVLQGGTPFGYINNDPTKPIYKYYWEAYDPVTGSKVEELTGDWGFTNTFLGYANLTYVVKAEDARGCQTTATRFIAAPDPVIIEEIKDITCFGETLASARIRVSGTEGRTFTIQYRTYAGGVPTSEWKGSATTGTDGIHEYTDLTYGDDLGGEDGHYEFRAIDSEGCISETVRHTFVPVQHELTAVLEGITDTKCGGDVTIKVFGGVAPYEVTIDGVTQIIAASNASTTFNNVQSGNWPVQIIDAHECTFVGLDIKVTSTGGDLNVYETFEVPVGGSGQYVNAEYGIDEEVDLAGSPYSFDITTDEGCLAQLILTVVEVGAPTTISEIHNGGDPIIGEFVDVVGTVTGIREGVGYYIQDAIAAWSGILILDPDTEVEIGDGVRIALGEVIEVDDVTCVAGVGEVIVPIKSTDYTPITVEPLVLNSPSEVNDEKYESVLVQVKGARATATVEDLWDIYYETDDIATVGNLLYAYTSVEGDFYHVTGIVDGTDDLYLLQPRFEADVINISETTPVDPDITDAIEFKLYPNPVDNTNDKLYIENYDKLTRITVTNIAGQRILDINKPVENYIRTANLVKGVYVVTLFTEKGIAKSERIVKR